MKWLSCSLFFLWCIYLPAQKKSTYVYSAKEFHTLYDFFEYETNLKTFFDIHPGEVIAGIGAAEGYHEAALSLLYDSITFYIEDVVPKKVSQKAIDKTVKHYSKLKSGPQTSTFIPVLGTYTACNLPDGIVDKMTLIASFHEFGNMDEVISDLAKKLKPDGKLYIMEAFCIDKVISCEDNHKGYYMKEVNTIMNRAGLHQTQMTSPESNIVDHVNVLVFEKNKAKSDRFFQTKNKLQPIVDKTKLFDQKEIASDSARMRSITDSIAANIQELKDLYVVYDEWIKGIGQKWKNKKEYACAANVLKAAILLFPEIAENYEALGEVYAAEGKEELSKACYAKACQLHPAKKCREKNRHACISIGL
jgi:tetratricopeptide (TPR) repeat protein